MPVADLKVGPNSCPGNCNGHGTCNSKGQEFGPTFKSATGIHFRLTHRLPSEHLAPSGAKPGSTSFSPKSTNAVRQGMMRPPELMKEWDKIATDSIPNSSLSLR